MSTNEEDVNEPLTNKVFEILQILKEDDNLNESEVGKHLLLRLKQSNPEAVKKTLQFLHRMLIENENIQEPWIDEIDGECESKLELNSSLETETGDVISNHFDFLKIRITSMREVNECHRFVENFQMKFQKLSAAERKKQLKKIQAGIEILTGFQWDGSDYFKRKQEAFLVSVRHDLIAFATAYATAYISKK